MATVTTKKTESEIYCYKDWGTGQPIVFSHGWPLTADDWDGQMLFFGQRGYRVIAGTTGGGQRPLDADVGRQRHGHLRRRFSRRCSRSSISRDAQSWLGTPRAVVKSPATLVATAPSESPKPC